MNIINDLLISNPSFILIYITIVALLLWIMLRSYIQERTKRLAQIEADYANIPKLQEIKQALSESEVIGNIEAKLSSLPQMSQIETAIADSIRKVDYQYWQYQEIDQIRRIKIEKIFELLHGEMALMSDAFAQITVHNNMIYNRRNILITILLEIYFPEIKEAINNYSKYCGNFQNIYTLATNDIKQNNVISSNILKSLKVSYENFGKSYQDLHDELIKCASGLTYHEEKNLEGISSIN